MGTKKRKEVFVSRTTKRGGRKRFFLSALLITCIVAVSAVVVGVLYVVVTIQQLPSPDQFSSKQISQSTKIYDRTGTVLLYEIHGEEKRTIIPLSDIPNSLQQATLAAEDSNFYTRPAFDWTGIARAVWVDLQKGYAAQGGSTITQQLARNVFLSGEKTITRKIKELILAIELESKYTKSQILGFYLNQIPYGSNAYGVEAASQTYFNTHAKDLTLSESAILAAMIRAPSYYSPWGTHIDDLLARRNYVLDRMAELGYITTSQAAAAKKDVPHFAPPSIGSIKTPHFSLAVKDYLINKYGEDMVVNGGLKVITTLDWSMQQAAEQAVADGVLRNTKLYKGTNGALVAQDPKTGQILAMVGSKDYFDTKDGGNFNVATQGLRQPGSTLKPFAYMLAFEKGYTPRTMIFDVPTEFVPMNSTCPLIPNFDATSSPDCFHPQDFENFAGPVSFAQALAQSINVAAVKVLYLDGLNNVLRTVRSFGITTLNDPSRYGLSLVLGGGEVKLIDLVNAYATLSQEGVRHDQVMVLEVRDANGNVLEEYRDHSTRVVDQEYPRVINQILSDQNLRAPLMQASLPLTVFPGRDVALKTGTTNDYRDAWAMGYTPSLVVGVWAGNNNNAPLQKHGSSILAAVPIWSDFLNRVLPNYPEEVFARPEPLPISQKPMLDGQYITKINIGGQTFPQVHSILYYVDKNNPLGPVPQNPSDDPQFLNWETGVVMWASQHIQNFGLFNQSVPFGASSQNFGGGVSIQNISPENGSFVAPGEHLQADITSKDVIKSVGIYINGIPLKIFDTINQASYHVTSILPNNLNPQNTIEVRAVTTRGEQASAQIIVYHK